MKNTITLIFIIIIAAVLAFAVGYFARPKSADFSNRLSYPNAELLRDTLYLPGKVKTVFIQSKPKIVYREKIKDTTAFNFNLDTISQKDTISISYIYPENLLTLKIKSMPDTNRIERIIINANPQSNSGKSSFITGTAIGLTAGIILALLAR